MASSQSAVGIDSRPITSTKVLLVSPAWVWPGGGAAAGGGAVAEAGGGAAAAGERNVSHMSSHPNDEVKVKVKMKMKMK